MINTRIVKKVNEKSHGVTVDTDEQKNCFIHVSIGTRRMS